MTPPSQLPWPYLSLRTVISNWISVATCDPWWMKTRVSSSGYISDDGLWLSNAITNKRKRTSDDENDSIGGRRRWVQSRNHYHEEPLEQCRSVGLTSVSPEKTIVVFIFSGETFSYCPKKSHKISRQNKKNQKHNDFNIKKWRSLWLVLISILKTVDWRLLFTVTELVSWNKPTTTTCHSVTRWRVCVYYISRLYLFIYIYISLYPLWLVVWWPYLCCLSHACTHPFSCQKFFDWFQKTKSINLIIHKSYNMCVYTHPYIHPCATIHIYTTLHITTTAYTFVYDMTTTISSWQQPTYHHHNNK